MDKSKTNTIWHRASDEKPPVGQRVVGVFCGTAAACSRLDTGSWWDTGHGCYCYTAPDYWAEMPTDNDNTEDNDE